MMAHNLCYSTLLSPTCASKLSEEDVTRTPSGDYFVKKHVAEGVLPCILRELLRARKMAKEDMKKEKDPLRYAVLDGRQLALKISANSVYGFTGAQVCQLPCLAISSSVTGFGRQMIEATKNLIEEEYSLKNGFGWDAQVLYGDTDSVMIKFGTLSVEESMKLGREAASLASTKLFLPPIKLEFEKVFFPWMLMNKKRYAGMYWTRPEKPDRMDCKGIETVRRDNCALVRRVMETCLKLILEQRNPTAAQEFVRSVVSDLLTGKIDISELIITKAFSRSAEDYKSKQPHVELAGRMRIRDAGSAPQVGDRIPFVMVQHDKKAKAFEKAEDPLFVLEHDLPLDTTYYLDQQLKKPVMRLFENLMPNPQQLFVGDHTLVRHTPPSQHQNKGIMGFVRVTPRCLGCKTPMNGNHTSRLCASCQPNQAVIYLQLVEQMQEAEGMSSSLWTQCQRCQGDLIHEVLCVNNSCPIFYKREQASKTTQQTQKILETFASDW